MGWAWCFYVEAWDDFVVGAFVAWNDGVGLGLAAWGVVVLMAGWGIVNS